jgi:hypothetical protein
MSTDPKRLAPQITGNAGLFFCCYRLSRLGWNVMPTARNARGVDIVAYNQDASRFIGVQVKALSTRAAVPLGASLGKVMGDFWVIVSGISRDPVAFVLLPAEVKALAHRNVKDGRASHWLEPSDYDRPQFREAWARIVAG